jgi:hypothetical protein
MFFPAHFLYSELSTVSYYSVIYTTTSFYLACEETLQVLKMCLRFLMEL